MPKRLARTAGDLQSLFLRLEELTLANSGADVFEETLKFLCAKWIDETFGSGVFANPTKAAVDACVVRAAQTWPGILQKPYRLELDDATAMACAALLAPFSMHDAGSSIDSLFETLLSRTGKGQKGQFFTPRYVVDFCVTMLAPMVHERVIDPACGSGAFLTECMSRGILNIAGFDIDSRAVRIAKLLLLRSGGDPNCIQQADMLRGGAQYNATFDCVLSNPPFAGDVIDQQLLSRYELGAARKRVDRDVLFLERCLQLVRPGGRIAVILPHNKFAGAGSLYARKWLLERAEVLAVVGLGRRTFLPHTHQKANVLVARRREGPRNGQEIPIFFALSEQDGKDARGRPTPHDLEEISQAYTHFRAREYASWR